MRKWKKILAAFLATALCVSVGFGSTGSSPKVVYAASSTVYPVQKFRIVIGDSDRNINISGFGDKSPLNSWITNGEENEKWYLEYQSEGVYKIINARTDKAITADNGRCTIDAVNNESNQLWKIIGIEQDFNGDDLFYKIVSYENENMAMTFKPQGNKVVLEEFNQGEYQKFKINCDGLEGFAGNCQVAEGEKAATVGGLFGETVFVDTLEELKNALVEDEPLTIVLTANIDCSGENYDWRIEDNKTLIGSYDNNQLMDCKLRTNDYFEEEEPSDNIIVRNIRFQIEKNKCMMAFAIYSSRNIWIDHCDFNCEFTKEYDEVGKFIWINTPFSGKDIGRSPDFMTFSYNTFSNRYWGIAFGTQNEEVDKDRATMIYNVFDSIVQRAPQMGNGTLHVMNNYYVRKTTSIDEAGMEQIKCGANSKIYSVANRFEGFKKESSGYWDRELTVYADSVITDVDSYTDKTENGGGTPYKISISTDHIENTEKPEENYGYKVLSAYNEDGTNDVKAFCQTYSGCVKSGNPVYITDSSVSGFVTRSYTAPFIKTLEVLQEEETTENITTTAEPTTKEVTSEEETTTELTTESEIIGEITTSEATTEEITSEEITTTEATTERITTERITTSEPTTEKLTTESVTTNESTTEKLTTESVTTNESTTEKLTTERETTNKPTTEKLTTERETTNESTTERLTTEKITTSEPTTEKLTTERETTNEPTTEKLTTERETTNEPTTEKLTTERETTNKPTTEALTTEKATINKPTTEELTTEKATTNKPTTERLTTEKITTNERTTERLTTEKVTTNEATTEQLTTEKITNEPTTKELTTEKITTNEATTEKLTTEKATTNEPTTEKLTTEKVITNEPTTEELTTEKATTNKPTTERLTTEKITTNEPTTERLTTEKVTTNEPTTKEWTTEKVTTNEATTEKVTTNEATTEKLTTEKVTTEMVTTEKTPVYVEKITITPDVAELVVGDTKELVLNIFPTNAENQKVRWSSTNADVVTVDQNGKITAVKAGQATIIVITEDEREFATCQITVQERQQSTTQQSTTQQSTTQQSTTQQTTTQQLTTQSPTTIMSEIKVEKVKVKEKAFTLDLKKTKTIKTVVYPANATNKKVTYASSNKTVATVDASGKVKAIAPGIANITIKAASGVSTKVTVKVKPAKVTAFKKTKLSKTKVKISWKKQSKVTGYKVYRLNTKTKTYKLYKITKRNYVSVANLKKNAVYTFKVKAYKRSGSVVVNGDYSKAFKVKIK